MLKRAISDERGRVLVWTLVVLGLGALLIPPLLAHVSANLLASRTIEEGLKEQYAADSGVEYALLQLQNGITTSQNPYTYTINTKYVEVTWGPYRPITETYKITSTATSHTDGTSTRIESYISVSVLDFLWLTDTAITSPGDVTIQPGSVVTGGVRCYEGELDEDELDRIDEWQPYPEEEDWPTAEQLSEFYLRQVEGLDPYPDDIIDVASGTEADPYPIEPLYYVGDLLQIKSSQVDAVAVLAGTVYVAGDLEIGKTGKDFTLDLNGQTIYVEGSVYAGTKCTLRGSGCIIAEEDITFLPHVDSNPDDFLFLMSTGGESTIQPGDSVYGAVAGNANVQLQPNCWLERTSLPEDGLNFPDGTTGTAQIHTYKVYP